MYVKLHEIRQVTGARCLADGHSAAFLINSANREEIKNNKITEMEEDISEDDNARMDPPTEESENKGKYNIYTDILVLKLTSYFLQLNSRENQPSLRTTGEAKKSPRLKGTVKEPKRGL